MGAKSNILHANFSKPSFKGNDKAASSDTLSPSAAAKNSDKFEKKENDQPKNKLLVGMTALAGTTSAGLAFTWLKLGKILKLVGVAVPFAFFGRLSKVRELSLRDGLTGLFNKDTLKATLAKDFKKFIKSKDNYSVGMLDMDNFKGFNEILGHEVGDKVLKRIAGCIHQVTKKHKLKGYRYGGEEFMVIMPNHNSESAQKILGEISEAIKKDEYIQGLLPKFKDKVQSRIAFLSPKPAQINGIFAKLRSKSGDSRKLANEITTLVESHIETYDPPHTKDLEEFIAKLKAAKGDGLRKLLQIGTKIGEDSCLGSELDKIYTQYNSLNNDRQKWIDHINRHKMFTVSGGVVNLQDASGSVTEGKELIAIADKALKAAKDNGKNSVVKANDELIKKVMDRIKKAKIAKDDTD